MTREAGYYPQTLQDPCPVSELPAAKITIPFRPIFINRNNTGKHALDSNLMCTMYIL
jgi:hypothetical protein